LLKSKTIITQQIQPMDNTEIRQKINKYLDSLTSERLQMVAEFLTSVRR